jgi:hypothetical protein
VKIESIILLIQYEMNSAANVQPEFHKLYRKSHRYGSRLVPGVSSLKRKAADAAFHETHGVHVTRL